jgi:voltage-gated potassium channel
MRRGAEPSLRQELLFMLLAAVSVSLIVLEALHDLSPHQQELFERVDLVIASLFLLEFLYRLVGAEDRKRFWARSWWELLAAIPVTADMTRALRGVQLLRAIRFIRILRIVRLGVRLHVVLARMRAFGEATHLVTITVTVTTIVLGGAVGFHYFEFGTNPNVKSFWDSAWWSLITVTTVGYGDIYPMTGEGRAIAAILLLVGLAAFGVFTAALASWMTRRNDGTREGGTE